MNTEEQQTPRISLDKIKLIMDEVFATGIATTELDGTFSFYATGYLFGKDMALDINTIDISQGWSMVAVQEIACRVVRGMEHTLDIIKLMDLIDNNPLQSYFYEAKIGFLLDKEKHLLVIEPLFHLENLNEAMEEAKTVGEKSIYDCNACKEIILED